MIRICGVPFKFVAITEGANMADLMEQKQTIEIDIENHADEMIESAVLHEIFHRLDHQFGLDLGERGTNVLEASLFEILTGAGIDFSPILDRIAEGTTPSR